MPQWTLIQNLRDPLPIVTVLEIKFLIFQMKSDKAPGPDLLSSELLKANGNWWMRILTPIFTQINETGIMSIVWHHAIIVSVHFVIQLIQIIISALVCYQ